jgi:hypothetical protein
LRRRFGTGFYDKEERRKKEMETRKGGKRVVLSASVLT